LTNNFEEKYGVRRKKEKKEGRSCRACFTGALGWVVLGGQGLGARGSCPNRLDQKSGLGRHVPYERPYSSKFRLTNFHKIDIFQSEIRRVAVQIFLRFQGKARGQKETFVKYR